MSPCTDALGITLTLSAPPQRIISLVPSQTELLHFLGLENEVVGITKFCVHPQEWHQAKTRVGGTRQLHLEIIKELQPDLVIANKEENVREQIEAISRFCPVFTTEVASLDDALLMIRDVSALVEKQQEGDKLVKDISALFSRIQVRQSLLRTAYLIWKDPFMAAGGDTFISDMMRYCGLENIFGAQKRYPEITLEQLRDQDCQLVLLSSEPYPFREKDFATFQARLPQASVVLADGEMFSWYGSRLLKAADYFTQLRRELEKSKVKIQK